jgi:hypothetical protein
LSRAAFRADPRAPNATPFPDLIELDYRIEPRFRLKPGTDDDRAVRQED